MENAGMGGWMGTILWLVIMIGLFYFMLIRPQKKKEKETKAMLEAVKWATVLPQSAVLSAKF